MKIAFYAPMNTPDIGSDDEPPSGDRLIARQLIEGLEALGHEVIIASTFKSWSREPDALEDLKAQAAGEVARLHGTPFEAWFTYHVYYKAPDLMGPWIARAQAIPYFIAEGSLSPSRKEGPWAEHYALTREALILARTNYCLSARDTPALAAENFANLMDLPPWVEVGTWTPTSTGPRAETDDPLRLVTCAMMREGDKLESYSLLAESLTVLELDWRLSIFGDGPARGQVEALFSKLGPRVSFEGKADHAALAQAYGTSDLFVWPGLGEGLGMVYLEAQAAGLAVIACDGPGPAAATSDASARLTHGTPEAFAWAISDLGGNGARRKAMAAAGRRLITSRFSKLAFLRILKAGLEGHI